MYTTASHRVCMTCACMPHGYADHPEDEFSHHTITHTNDWFDLWRIITKRNALRINKEFTKLATYDIHMTHNMHIIHALLLWYYSYHIFTRCATPSLFLEYDCSASRPYRCAWRARTRRPHTHATSEGSTTQTRLLRRRWSTSKLTDRRWKFSFKSKLCALLHRSCIDQIV